MVDELYEVDGDDRIVLRVHVQPGAGRSEFVGRHGDALKVRVAAPPERGRANDACIRLLAEVFDVKASAVTLVGGGTSRSKRFAIEGIDGEHMQAQLERVLDAGSARLPSGRPPNHTARP
jgi:uncharacterized protein (TIGR00251 family)